MVEEHSGKLPSKNNELKLGHVPCHLRDLGNSCNVFELQFTLYKDGKIYNNLMLQSCKISMRIVI